MSTHESMQALHRANPRTGSELARSVEAVRARIGTPEPVTLAARSLRPRLAGTFAVVSLTATAAAAALLGIGLPGGGSGVVGVERAEAAVRAAATTTASSAERSGSAVVRIRHDGRLWAAKSVTWNGSDLSLADLTPGRDGKVGSGLRVVEGTMYAPDPEGRGWVRLGSPDSIDPGSGTTPAEYLAAVREDVGGATLRWLTDGISGLTARTLADGSALYAGSVPARAIARETGFKEGQHLRVLPFGYVAHDEAADPTALLRAEITVGQDGIVREIVVSWGTWRYAVSYSGLGATPAPLAPADAHPLKRHVPRADG
jgi:hypothetical protein